MEIHFLAHIREDKASKVSKRNSATSVKPITRTPAFRHFVNWNGMLVDDLGRTRRNHYRIDFDLPNKQFPCLLR